jgi:hypothetical protein
VARELAPAGMRSIPRFYIIHALSQD